MSKVSGELSVKVGGELSKVGGELSKVGGEFGGLFGPTVIKNFADAEGRFITSRKTPYFPESSQPRQRKKAQKARRHNGKNSKGSKR